MIYIREFIIQWNSKGSLDLFEYTKDKEIIKILFDTYVLDIVNYISNVKENLYVWIEKMPIYKILTPEFDKLNINYGRNTDAEKWERQMRRDGNRHISYIHYWWILKPIRIEDMEQKTFDYEKFGLL